MCRAKFGASRCAGGAANYVASHSNGFRLDTHCASQRQRQARTVCARPPSTRPTPRALGLFSSYHSSAKRHSIFRRRGGCLPGPVRLRSITSTLLRHSRRLLVPDPLVKTRCSLLASKTNAAACD